MLGVQYTSTNSGNSSAVPVFEQSVISDEAGAAAHCERSWKLQQLQFGVDLSQVPHRRFTVREDA